MSLVRLGFALASIAMMACSSASMLGTGAAGRTGAGDSSAGASGAGGSEGGVGAAGQKTAAGGTDAFDAGAADASGKDDGGSAGDLGTPAEDLGARAGDGGGDGDAGDATAPEVGGPFTLTSSAFREGDLIPLTYQCMHENVSPPLAWTAGPAGTRSYAVTMIHAIADMSLHWVVWDIPAETRMLSMNVAKVAEPPTPSGSKQVKTNIDSATWFGYVGPCPHGPSSNLFAVYALDVATLPGVTTQSTPTQVDAAIRNHKLASATLTGASK